MMPENSLAFFQNLNNQLPEQRFSFETDGACQDAQKLILDVLLDNQESIPKSVKIFSCNNESMHSPHYWVEIQLANGSRYVWDITKQKMPFTRITPLSEAMNYYNDYSAPTKLQIIP